VLQTYVSSSFTHSSLLILHRPNRIFHAINVALAHQDFDDRIQMNMIVADHPVDIALAAKVVVATVTEAHLDVAITMMTAEVIALHQEVVGLLTTIRPHVDDLRIHTAATTLRIHISMATEDLHTIEEDQGITLHQESAEGMARTIHQAVTSKYILGSNGDS
jgi:hypothetical protein